MGRRRRGARVSRQAGQVDVQTAPRSGRGIFLLRLGGSPPPTHPASRGAPPPPGGKKPNASGGGPTRPSGSPPPGFLSASSAPKEFSLRKCCGGGVYPPHGIRLVVTKGILLGLGVVFTRDVCLSANRLAHNQVSLGSLLVLRCIFGGSLSSYSPMGKSEAHQKTLLFD